MRTSAVTKDVLARKQKSLFIIKGSVHPNYKNSMFSLPASALNSLSVNGDWRGHKN